MNLLSRRNFIKKSTLAGAGLLALPSLVSASPDASLFKTNKKSGKSLLLKKGNVILFQGDSITDARRRRDVVKANDGYGFGNGYAFLAATQILKEHYDKDLKIYNRGISGNKVFQLAERWQKDCLDLKPDFLSILVGVNDYWHLRQGRYEGNIETYEEGYRRLLDRTLKELPNVKLIICEPFVIPGTSVVDESWIKPIKKYQDTAKRICEDYNAVWVSFQRVFNKALKQAPATYWAADGIHPTMAGCCLMAEAWRESVFG